MSHTTNVSKVIRDNIQFSIDQYLSEFQNRTNGFTLPSVIYEYTYEQENIYSEPVFYIGIPVKNQEIIIEEVLEHLIVRLTSPTEIGLLFDNCTDLSFQRARDFLMREMGTHENLIRVHFLRSEDELFESTCENLLFELSDARYLVSFQSDVLLLDGTFFERCKKAFAKVDHLLGVSGRATIPLMPIKSISMRLTSLLSVGNLLSALLPRFFQKRYLGPFLNGFSYFGDTSGYPTPVMNFSRSQVNSVYIGQSLIRGPIVWSREKFEILGGFNDVSYFLGRDDCDISLRGLVLDFKVGFLPCVQTSNPKNGTTRKPRTPSAQLRLRERSNLAKKHPGDLDSFWNMPFMQRRKLLKKFSFGKIKI